MITYNHQFRVAYPDTDQMGSVHHANYAKYYETARWELLRSIGISYNELEKSGIMCPVVDMSIKFIKSTKYDELLICKTTLREIKGVRMWFDYEIYNNSNELINRAETTLAFVTRDWRPCKVPTILLNLLDKNEI